MNDDESPDLPELDSRRLLHAFDWGAAWMLLSAVVYGLLMDPIGLSWGLVAIAIGGGWLIGKAVLRGAWGVRFGQPVGILGRPSWVLQGLAVALALGAWLLAFGVGYFTSQQLPGAAPVPFGPYLTSIAGFHSAVGLAAFAIMAWRSARWTLPSARPAR